MDKKKIIIISSIAAILLIVIPALIFIYTPGSAPYHINQNAVELPPESPADPPAPVAFTIAPTALGDISITALSTSDLGVATDTAFLITSDVHTLAEAHLLAYLSAGNGNSFTLEAQPDNAFLLRFEDDLTPNQIYNLIYSPPGRQAASHAFQTADIFRVTATSPANHAHGVPYDAGIEVTFSQPLADDTDFEAAFSIDPPVEGRFYQRDNIFIFAPYALDYSIRYTVTIAQGLVSATGEVLEEDHVFTFNTLWGSGSGPAFSMFGNPYETFLPWDEIFISIGLGWEFEGRDFYVSLYDMEEWEAFIAAGIDESVTGTLIDTFELEAQDFEVDWQPVGYLFLDRTLPVGYYMAVIRSTQEDIDITLRKFIQVSALSVYSLSIEDETVFWVNDASTGQPASGAQVSLNAGGLAATTDSDGVAIIAIPEEIVAEVENNRLVITIEHANHLPFAYTKPVFDRSHPQISDRFLSFIYTDRPTYRPTDTVDVFGVIQPRYGHAHSPNDVFTLHFGNMLELPIELSRFNTFSVRVPIADMFSGVSVSVQINGEWLASRWISIADYANHSYVISGELDRLAYFLGERAEAELHVTSFAGRPVPGVQLTTHSHGEAINTTTNNNGLATASVFVPSHYRGWMPFWGSFWFSITSEIQTSQSITLPMIVAPSDVMMEHEISGDTATITTSQVLLDNIEAHYADVSPWSNINPDNFRGDPVDVNFTITINRYTTTRTVRTRQYDHINRRTINVYQFDTESELYRVLMGNTVDGQTIVTGLPVSNDPMIRYSIEVTYEDTQQRPVTVWLSDQNWWPGRDAVQESPVRHFSFALDRWMLGIGETTQVSLVENPDPWGEWRWHGSGADENSVPVTQGRMITILARDGVETVAVGSPRGIPITFTENLISSAVIFGAYFDGRYIFPIANFSNPPTIWFNHADRELEIELEFDQDSYRPGDEVTVTIQTSAPGQVAISVVDESSLMDRWHEVNFLQRFYQSAMANFWAMRPTQFSSHTQHNIADHHDRGGFGGEHEYAATADSPADAFAASDPTFRDFFVDNPAFEVVETDSNGVATLTFTLADQVTSWRVTALGITEDGYAGDTRYNIISYLPFYVDLILTNEYIAGDDIAALARTFGSDEEPVDFTFNVLHDGEVIFTDTQTATGNAIFNAGKLEPGSYTMQVTAVFEDYSDAVELPFTVVQSGMILPVRATGSVEDIDTSTFDMRPLPVRITLTNGNIGPLTDILFSAWNTRSHRTDYMAAAAYISYFLGHTDTLEVRDVRSRLHRNDGIPEVVYEPEEFYYTARFAASFPEFVDRGALIRYIRREMEHTYSSRHAAGLMALAAVGEPVLLQIQDEVASLHDIHPVNYIDYMTAIYLAAALVAIGDDAGAMHLMATLPQPFEGNLSITERETLNTVLLFINTAIHPQVAWDHLNRGSSNVHVSDVAERINFVRRAAVLGETISEVQYYLNGTTHTVRLEHFDRVSLHISHEQFEALNLTPISGATDFHIDFYGYDATNWDADGNRIGIRRSIVRDGDLFRVDIQVTIPPDATGFYTIHDRLPSNLRFLPMRRLNDWERDWFNHFWITNPQRQLVEIRFWADRDRLDRTFSYHALELFEADMAPGTAYISNGDAEDHVWGRTE